MTWYASQIIASGAPDVVKTLQATPAFADRLFLLDQPLRKSWNEPDATYDLPPDGLLFLRSICCPDDHISEWMPDELVISTETFASLPGADLAIDPGNLDQYGFKEGAAIIPYRDPLRFAKRLSRTTDSKVAFYYCFFWGGLPEVEFAWAFAGDSERVFLRLFDGRPGANRLLEIGPHGAEEKFEDVLVATMAALDCQLPSPYFDPHTRSFAWDERRL